MEADRSAAYLCGCTIICKIDSGPVPCPPRRDDPANKFGSRKESDPASEAAEHEAMSPHGKGSWYFVSRWVCVLCGSTTEYRERRWTEKPTNPAERQEYIEEACGVHFC